MVFKIFTAKNGKEFVIRSIVASDLSRVKEYTDYMDSVIAEKDYILLKKKVSLEEEIKFIKKAIIGPEKDSYTFVVECDKKIVGTTTTNKKMGVMDHIASTGFVIRKEYRSIGIGNEMIKIAIATAKKMKCKILELEVFSTNKRAISLYEKFGFKKVARLPKTIQRRGKLIDEFIMFKEL